MIPRRRLQVSRSGRDLAGRCGSAAVAAVRSLAASSLPACGEPGRVARAEVDLEAAFPFYGGNHGFSTTLAASPGTHTVCVTASNIYYGDHTRLGCRTVTVTDPHAPIGNYEEATAVPGGGQVKGWAIDPDTTAPIYVWVTVDGIGRHLYANQDRPDVGTVYPAFGANHGFTGTVAAAPGSHRVCVTASDVGPGAHTSLGCRTVNVP